MDRALALKKPVDRISSSSSDPATAIAAGVGNRRKSSGVTPFTRASVHWAERIVAIRSWNASAWSSEQSAPGYPLRKRSRTSAAGAGRGFERVGMAGGGYRRADGAGCLIPAGRDGRLLGT